MHILGLASKVKTLLWFAPRPKYWVQIWGILSRKLHGEMEQSQEEAEAWGYAVEVTEAEAIERLFGDVELRDPKVEYRDRFATAQAAADAAPVKMGGAGNLTLLFSVASNLGELRAVETGVAYGWSSLALLLLAEESGGAVASVDMPYVRMSNEDFVGCVIPDDLRERWTLIREADRTGIKKALARFDGSINLCHYDSDKSYAGRMWSYPKLWDALVTGGVFMSDDIGDNLAFRHFAEQVGVEPIVVRDGKRFVGVMKKPG